MGAQHANEQEICNGLKANHGIVAAVHVSARSLCASLRSIARVQTAAATAVQRTLRAAHRLQRRRSVHRQRS